MDGIGTALRRTPAAPSLAQGAYYTVTGVWPLLSRRSFEAVTGAKTDWWLVQTVGVLVAVIGTTLAGAGARGRPGAPVRWLGVGSALGLATVDVVHVARGRIGRVYLLDAAAELGLATAWLVAARRDRRTETAGTAAGPPREDSAPTQREQLT